MCQRPPRGFSEFAVLGAYAFTTHRTKFAWYDADDPGVPQLCTWYWSRAGIDAAVRQELNRHIG